jgi:hypothetical protein
MDKISDFFKELKDRFSNPLFFSFIIGWVAINWKIVVGLLFYSMGQLEKDGYSSYLNLINKNSSLNRTLLFPFLIALSYTFIFPIVRNWISMFNAWNQRWGTDRTLKIAREGMISVTKYIDLRNMYDNRLKKLDEIVKLESRTMSDNLSLQNEKRELENHLRETELELRRINDNNDSRKTLSGEWLIKIGLEFESKRIIIINDVIYANDNREKSQELYRVMHLAYNNFTYEMIIVFAELKGAGGIFTDVFSDTFSKAKVFKNKSNKGKIMELKREE